MVSATTQFDVHQSVVDVQSESSFEKALEETKKKLKNKMSELEADAVLGAEVQIFKMDDLKDSHQYLLTLIGTAVKLYDFD